MATLDIKEGVILLDVAVETKVSKIDPDFRIKKHLELRFCLTLMNKKRQSMLDFADTGLIFYMQAAIILKEEKNHI